LPIADLLQIRLLGEKKREENLRFRRFLKSHGHSDRVLRRIAEGVQDRIDYLAGAEDWGPATRLNPRFATRYRMVQKPVKRAGSASCPLP